MTDRGKGSTAAVAHDAVRGVVAVERADSRVERAGGAGDGRVPGTRGAALRSHARTHRDGWAAAAVFAAALAYLLALRPFERPLMLDPATWDYMSVQVARGMIPYRDVFLHKTPGAALLGGAGAAVAAALGAPAVWGAHGAFLVLGAAGAALLYAVCVRTMPLLVALAASAFLLAFDQWPLASVEGVRPQVAVVTFGLACLLSARRRRHAWAGVFGAMSTLCWQPGLAFLAGALWTIRADLVARRLAPLVRMTAGALLPPALLLGWLASQGALAGFFAQAVGFNVSYIELMAKTPAHTLAKIAGEFARMNATELVLLPLAVLGLWLRRSGRDDAGGRSAPTLVPPGELLVAGAAYLAMTFVSFQAWPDTILLGAPLAAILAAGLARLFSAPAAPVTAGALVLAVAAASAAAPSASRLSPPITYQEQGAAMLALAGDLGPHDTVVAVSAPELLLHTDRTSRWPWPYMWFGVDRFAARATPGGFDAILHDLEQDPPRLIVLARRWAGPLRAKLNRWLAPRYTREVVRIYPHEARPMIVYRLRDPVQPVQAAP